MSNKGFKEGISINKELSKVLDSKTVKWQQIKATVEGFVLSFSDGALPTLELGLDVIQRVLNLLGDLGKGFAENSVLIRQITGKLLHF